MSGVSTHPMCARLWQTQPALFQSKISTLRIHTLTHPCCMHYVVISAISNMSNDCVYEFLWKPCVGKMHQCGLLNHPFLESRKSRKRHFHQRDGFLFGWLYVYFSKKGFDRRWCTMINLSLYISFYTLAAAPLRHCYTCRETNCLENVSHSFWHEIGFHEHSFCATRNFSK